MGFKTWLFGFEMVGIVTVYTSAYLLPNPLGYFSLYGICMLTYFLIQSIASAKNDRKMKEVCVSASSPAAEEENEEEEQFEVVPLQDKNVVLLVVGHRENPEYWKKCLLSICQLDVSNLRKVYVYIDGIEPEDLPMYDIAEAVLKEHTPVGFPPVEICRLDKRGKRGLLYRGIETIRHEYRHYVQDMLVAVTDSDTELDPQSLVRLQRCIESDPQNGCATGILSIYNQKDGILPKLIHARYRYAFGIERSCLSYFGCMTCCSGPLSMYRLHVLPETIMKRFVTQSLGGVLCEPGDDRHLTNLVMSQGYFSRQTSYAEAGTEAPETLMRFLLQQLRWSRSFYRELKWQLQCLDHQSYFLGISSVYESLFPWFILIWLFYTLYTPQPLHTYVEGLFLSLLILFLRTLSLFVRFRETVLLYNVLYYPMYFFFLLPTKLFAAGSLFNNTWVTQSRDTRRLQCSKDAVVYFIGLGVWQILLVTGIVRTVSRFFGDETIVNTGGSG